MESLTTTYAIYTDEIVAGRATHVIQEVFTVNVAKVTDDNKQYLKLAEYADKGDGKTYKLKKVINGYKALGAK